MSEPTDRDDASPQSAEGRGDPLSAIMVGCGSVSLRGRESFPKECRILHRSEFSRIQRQGQRVHGPRLIFQFLPGRTSRSRLGLTVSKKVGNAVVRNRIKRWLREAFRRHPELRPDRPPHAQSSKVYDLVITAKRDVDDFSFAVLEAELVDIVGRYLDGRFDRRKGSGRDGKGARGEHPPESRGPAGRPTNKPAGPGPARG